MIQKVLENDELCVTILPEFGAKISSIYFKKKRFELAAPNTRGMYLPSDAGTRFEDRDASGLDDAFPNINEETVTEAGRTVHYRDHGDIWRSAFDVVEVSEQDITLRMYNAERGYLYQKRIEVRDNTVQLHYEITNLTEEPFPALWAFHGLLRYEEDMTFFYPDGTDGFINAMKDPVLGEADRCYRPDSPVYDFTRVPAKDSLDMKKFYVQGKVKEGRCGCRYPKAGVCCTLSYDAAILPYLGVWITAGGYRGDYNCALEPSNGYYDAISKARSTGTLAYLKPGQPWRFTLTLSIEEENC